MEKVAGVWIIAREFTPPRPILIKIENNPYAKIVTNVETLIADTTMGQFGIHYHYGVSFGMIVFRLIVVKFIQVDIQ